MTLTQIGLLLTAVAQFAPGIIGGAYWKRGSYRGVTAGLVIGSLVWSYTLLLPELLSSNGPSALLREGLFGLAWLRPHALFGVEGLDPIAHGTFWSLTLNTLAYVAVSLAGATRPHERHERVDRELVRMTEDQLAGVLEHLSLGVSVVDAELRLVAWNKRYVELFDYAPGMVVVGRPIEELMRYNVERGLLRGADIEVALHRRLERMRAGTSYTHERELPDGTVLEIHGNPMPGGGFVATYSDVTARKRAQRVLVESNEMLETRVAERTQQLLGLNRALAEAKADADRANFSKTRFLAAASHDLAQPITAARLFISSLPSSALSAPATALVGQAGNALTTAETLLTGLLDISRLDAGAEEVRLTTFELSALLHPLAAEFQVFARSRGLTLRLARCNAVVHSDMRLLRRVLQNFLSNAVRYTSKGRILLGARRARGALRIEVWDTGPGIPAARHAEVFEEFRRLEVLDANGERGLGLGLAIADRTAHLLGYELSLRSRPGVGSVFSISVPIGDRAAIPSALVTRAQGPDRVAGSTVVCLENDPAVLSGIQALLGEWGCNVIGWRDRESAFRCIAGQAAPDLMLIDYHLDGEVSGISLAQDLRAAWQVDVPGIVITADHTQLAKQSAAMQGYLVLPKPIRPAALRALMNRMLA